MPGPAQRQADRRRPQAPPGRRFRHPVLQSWAQELEEGDGLAQELGGRGGRCRRRGGIVIDVAVRRPAEIGLVGADREGNEVGPALEVAAHAVADARPLLVEHVVDHDDAALGDRRFRRGQVMRRDLGGVATIDADEAQRAFRQPRRGWRRRDPSNCPGAAPVACCRRDVRDCGGTSRGRRCPNCRCCRCWSSNRSIATAFSDAWPSR